MRWMRQIWEELEEKIIFNCWAHTGIANHLFGDDGGDTEILPEINAEENELMELVAEVIPPTSRITIDNLLNPDGEDDCIAVISDEYLANQIASTVLNQEESESEGEIEEIEKKLTPGQELEALRNALHILDGYGLAPVAVRGAIYKAQRGIRKQRVESMTQGRIAHYFK